MVERNDALEGMGRIEGKDMGVKWDYSLSKDAMQTEVIATKKRNHRQRYRAARLEEFQRKKRGQGNWSWMFQ